jgi:hypothetical protein
LECNKQFAPRAHNAIYCGDECRKKITNKRVLEKYYEKKEEKESQRTSERICLTSDCQTVLSIYNDDETCSSCQVSKFKDKLDSWGWDRKKLDEDWSY